MVLTGPRHGLRAGSPAVFRPSLEKRLQRKATLTWSGQSSAALQLIVTASVDI